MRIVCPGLHKCPWTSLLSSISSFYWPDEHTDSLHGVEAAAIVGPEDSILKFVAVYASHIPYAIQVGLAASIVPPASFMEMRTVTCNRIWVMVICFYRSLELDFKVKFQNIWRGCMFGYLRRHLCLDPEWWTACRCGCWESPQRCPGRSPVAGGSPRSLAPDGSCCTERRLSCSSSPPALPLACSLPASPAYRCPPVRASIPRRRCQSHSDSKGD